MKLFKRIMVFTAIFSASMFMSCGKEPLLTNIGTNQLIVVLKGTYESNGPMDWAMPDACLSYADRNPGVEEVMACSAYTPEHLDLVQDDSVVFCDGENDASTSGAYGKDDTNPTVFLIDISEIKLMDYNGSMHKFANYRQTYAFGLGDGDPFFNGIGYPLENDDAPSKVYAGVLLYVRKMLMDGARKYTPEAEGWRSSPVWDVFSENELPSFNFNKYQMHSFYDKLRYESAYLNRVYPLAIPISDLKGMVFSNEFPVTVLEIRIVVKNFIKKYEMQNEGGSVNSATHFYAFSDWLQDVQADDKMIGGNILTVARSYIPGFVGSVSGSIPAATAAPGRHVIAIPHGADINEYTIAENARSVNNCNLPRSPSLTLSTNISQMLDYYLKVEKYNHDWNDKVPSSCDQFNTDSTDDAVRSKAYCKEWDKFAAKVGSKGFNVPELAVFAKIDPAADPPRTGEFTIENVSPGSYDLYMANVAPTYGKFYTDGQFTAYPNNPVSVGPGSCRDSLGNTSIDFP